MKEYIYDRAPSSFWQFMAACSNAGFPSLIFFPTPLSSRIPSTVLLITLFWFKTFLFSRSVGTRPRFVPLALFFSRNASSSSEAFRPSAI